MIFYVLLYSNAMFYLLFSRLTVVDYKGIQFAVGVTVKKTLLQKLSMQLPTMTNRIINYFVLSP